MKIRVGNLGSVIVIATGDCLLGALSIETAKELEESLFEQVSSLTSDHEDRVYMTVPGSHLTITTTRELAQEVMALLDAAICFAEKSQIKTRAETFERKRRTVKLGVPA